MFPKTKTGRPGKDLRLIFNTVLWDCLQQWILERPSERFGSWKTVYSHFCKWRDEETLLKVFEHLRMEMRLPYLQGKTSCGMFFQ